MKLVGHYNPSWEYPSLVIPIYCDGGQRLFAFFPSLSEGFQGVPASLHYVRYADTLQAKLSSFDPRASALFALSEEEVTSMDHNNQAESCRQFFADGSPKGANPFILIAIATASQDQSTIRQVLRNCLLDLGADLNEFTRSWYMRQRERSAFLMNALPSNPAELLEGGNILRVATSSDGALALRRIARAFNGGSGSADASPVWLAILEDDSWEPSDPELPERADVLLSDLAFAPLAEWSHEPVDSIDIGAGELALALNPAFWKKEEEQRGWRQALRAAFDAPSFCWIRPRSSSPIGSLTDLGIQRPLNELSEETGKPLSWSIWDLERKVTRYLPTERERLTSAFESGRWHVDAVVAQKHAIMAAFSGAPAELKPIVLVPEEPNLLVPYQARLLHRDFRARSGFKQFDVWLSSQLGQETVRRSGLLTVIPPSETLGAVASKAERASLAIAPAQRPVAVCVVLDVSGSMAGQKIDGAKLGTSALLGQLNPERGDVVGLLTFSDTVREMVPLEPVETSADRIALNLATLETGGKTALLDAVLEAASVIAKWLDSQQAIVVLTDGCDNASRRSEKEVLGTVALGLRDGPRVYCLAYGEDADYDFLLRISEATRGAALRGGIASVRALFKRIASSL